RYPAQTGRDEGKVVEARQPTQRPPAADPVAAELCLDLDVLDDLGAEEGALPQQRRVGVQSVVAHSATRHISKSALSKLYSRLPEVIFVKAAGAGPSSRWRRSRSASSAASSASGAPATASLSSFAIGSAM